jgi:UDP-3-O-[3-hydroxymyristoyl] glucosamine N-acyltransferase
LKLRDLAERLDCRLEGDGNIDILRVSGIEQAQPGDLTFVANRRYYPLLRSTRASAVILGSAAPEGPSEAGHDVPTPEGPPEGGHPRTAPSSPPEAGRHVPPVPYGVLRSDHPYLTFARALGLFVQTPPPAKGVDRQSAVAPDATLGADVSIGPFVAIGAGASIGARTVIYPHVVIGPGARIGEDCLIYSQVSIRERVVVGNRVIVQNGAVVGSDGFGFAKQPDGTHFKIPQHADVVVEDDVEIGANTTIDRPAVGETRIRAGAKIDNLVQIAHGVSVGRRVLFAAQVGIAGSTVVDDDVVLAGQVGVGGHLRVGKGVKATGQTGITRSLEPEEFVSGCPSIPNREWLKSSAVFPQLPALKKRVAELEQRIADLQEKLDECLTRLDR